MKRSYTNHFFNVGILLVILFLCYGCEDFVDVNLPNTKITREAVFNDDATATAAVLGMYEIMLRGNGFASSGSPLSLSTITGVYSDEFDNYYAGNKAFAENTLTASDQTVLALWTSFYSTVYAANSVIEGLQSSSTITPALSKQLEGEARFVRAFCHFYLVNLFGKIPIVNSTDYRVNAKLARSDIKAVYQFITEDLASAELILSTTFVSAERARPTSWAAAALLARVYLFTGDWAKAEAYATKLIENTSVFSLTDEPSSAFAKGSIEAIWQLASTMPTLYNTYEGIYYVLNAPPQIQSISTGLHEAFEQNDKRSAAWIGVYDNGMNEYFFPYKYKVKGGSNPLSEHAVVLRLAEQYLIRAEARANQGMITGANSAATDLNMIRTRSGLPAVAINAKEEMLEAILAERRIEFFSEWGTRWLDLKRSGQADIVLGSVKLYWDNNDLLFPIPEKEISNNTNLTQNPGY
ncbi:MAG TPA: RagB/SusD family nutrient uptake outer membrane protein [Chryseosolibacter sp.]|nr:RagB/SusD family nutrient uptake outer membrane protein [Chryseosolibacter sp.]